MQFKIKAGRFAFDKETKKVKAQKTKGLIHVIHNEEQQETHFKWANLDSHVQELDIIVFPGDAVFEAVTDKTNTFVLRFGMDDDRYFFWFQEKTDVEIVVKEINRIINYEQQSNMVDQKPASKVQPDQQPSKPVTSTQASKPSPQPAPQVNADFISKLVQGIAAVNKNQKHHHYRAPQTAIIHLTQAVTPQSLSTCLKSLTPEQLQSLAQFMPEEHKDKKYLSSTVHSPQFLQALDVLSDALNSENALPIFMEMGLSQAHLEKNYGVQAFLLALVDKFTPKYKKQEKQEQKKQEQMKDEKQQNTKQ